MVTYQDTDDTVWKAVADARRRQIIDTLSQGPMLTGDIVAMFPDIGRTGVMKHIDILQEAGFISIRREGRNRWNELNPAPLRRVCSPWIASHVEAMSRSLTRLKTIAESEPPRRKPKP